MKANQMHHLFVMYFIIQPVYVSDMFTAHHQEAFTIYTVTGACYMYKLLTPELNPYAQSCLPRIFTGILIFKGLTARRLYKSFGVKGLAF
jgi:hypothetical protein